MMMKISDLRNKDVISNNDGKRLGFIRDIEIDPDRGGIDAIVIPGETKFFSLFGKGDELVISWDRIRKIGVDVILVDSESNIPRTTKEKPRPQKETMPAAVNPEDEDLDFFTF